MSQSTLVGSRIRERRVMLGLKQSELAKEAGISPSYLNLIEHNRRRIGGKTLLRLAELMQVEPAQLSEGAEAALLSALRVAAKSDVTHAAELDRTEEFAGRFPGWAGVLSALNAKNEALEQTVKALTDRLENDPHLAASLHDVISTVTAIRSTASILVDEKTLEPEWQARFHRNINEDSRRLAEGAEALVKYLEAAPDADEEVRSPLDEMHAFLAEHEFAFQALEVDGGEAQIPELIANAPALTSDAARELTHQWLTQYHSDARELPLRTLSFATDELGVDPEALAARLDVPLPLLFRRMTALSTGTYGPVGLVSCDVSGAILFRKPIPGFSIPHGGGSCPLWPLFRALLAPMQPVITPLRQAGRDNAHVMSYSVAEPVTWAQFGSAPPVVAYMLLLPGRQHPAERAPHDVGTNCRICPVRECAARREPSLLGDAG